MNDSEGGSIINGEPVEIEQYPYQAALFDNTGFQFCGANVIDHDIILTAQHCVDTISVTNQVGAGYALLSEMV